MHCLFHKWDGYTRTKYGQARAEGRRYNRVPRSGMCYKFCSICERLGRMVNTDGIA